MIGGRGGLHNYEQLITEWLEKLEHRLLCARKAIEMQHFLVEKEQDINLYDPANFLNVGTSAVSTGLGERVFLAIQKKTFANRDLGEYYRYCLMQTEGEIEKAIRDSENRIQKLEEKHKEYQEVKKRVKTYDGNELFKHFEPEYHRWYLESLENPNIDEDIPQLKNKNIHYDDEENEAEFEDFKLTVNKKGKVIMTQTETGEQFEVSGKTEKKITKEFKIAQEKKAEADRLKKEQEKADKIEAERIEKEEKAEADRLKKEQEKADKIEADRIKAEKDAEAKRLKAEQDEIERKETERQNEIEEAKQQQKEIKEKRERALQAEAEEREKLQKEKQNREIALKTEKQNTKAKWIGGGTFIGIGGILGLGGFLLLGPGGIAIFLVAIPVGAIAYKFNTTTEEDERKKMGLPPIGEEDILSERKLAIEKSLAQLKSPSINIEQNNKVPPRPSNHLYEGTRNPITHNIEKPPHSP